MKFPFRHYLGEATQFPFKLSEARAVLPRQGEGLRALPAQRRLPVQAESAQDGDHPALLRGRRRTLQRSEEDRQLCRRHFWRSEGFHGETKTRHGPRRAARPRQHEYPVLPDGRRDQPEVARGRYGCAIPRLRPDSDARNARFRGSGAMGGPDSPNARRIRLTPPGGPPTGRAASAGPEIAEGRVVQRPHALFLLVRGPPRHHATVRDDEDGRCGLL